MPAQEKRDRRARRLAGLLNILPIAAFGLWSLPTKCFWLVLLGIVPLGLAVPAPEAVMPWFVGALLVGPFAFLLPDSFHAPRRFEVRGELYRRLGIEQFRLVVANGDLVNRFVRARHRRYSVYGAEIEQLVPRSILNERRHLAYFGWGMVSAAYALHIGWPIWAIWLAGSNVGANLYPAMLQRYSRARVARLAEHGLRRRRGPALIGLGRAST